MVGGTGDLDTLIGGLGDDFYEINDTLDTVNEAAGEGIDGVRSAIETYFLGDNVEQLFLYNAAINGFATNSTI